MIDKDDGAPVFGQTLCGTLLVVPREATLRIRSKFDVVWRVGVDEIAGFKRDHFHVRIRECPILEQVPIGAEVARVGDPCIATEWHVELPAAVESAKAIETRAVEIVKDRGGFLRVGLSNCEQRVESFAMGIEQVLVILHRHVNAKTLLEPSVKIDQVLIRIVEERSTGRQTDRDRKTSAERLDQPSRCVLVPERQQMKHLPSLAARPFEWWTKSQLFDACFS